MDVTELFTVIKKHKIERKMETLPTLLLDSLVHALLSRSDTVYRLLEELDENADGVLSMKELGDAFSRLVSESTAVTQGFAHFALRRNEGRLRTV